MQEDNKTKRVLVIGAGGFIGGYIAAEALNRGLEVWAGVRHSTSREYLQDPALHFLELDFEEETALSGAFASALPEGDKWDYIVYNLGATKCVNFADFNRINFGYLRNVLTALQNSGKVPDKLLYMSSLSVLGPGDEVNYSPFTGSSVPHPNTRYGASKLKAEMLLMSSDVPYIIFRSTGVYGPREKDYYLMFKCISKGFDFSVGYRRQMLSFIYVEDLARAIFDALEKAPVRRCYNVSEDRCYTQKEFRKMVAKSLGKKFVLPVCVPLWAARVACKISERMSLVTMKPTTLNTDKYNILAQRNWSSDITDAVRDFGFNPQVPLRRGVDNAVAWYRENGWL